MADTFVVNDIRVIGLERIDVGTVYNDLPVKVGDTFDTLETSDVIRTLYRTGFFSDINLSRDGDTLIVTVVERPAIGYIKVTGNNDIDTEELLTALKDVGIAEGQTFDPSVLERVEQEMEQQYFSHGKYGIIINTQVKELERNRVGIDITIAEGQAAKIRQINIVGNHVFTEEELLEQIESSTPGWFTWFSGSDQYSKERLQGDLEVLSSFYFDQGYLDFKIESTQIAITPDKKDIYITINIYEGQQYFISDIEIVGETIVSEEELRKFIFVKEGELYSRRMVTESANYMSIRIGNEGYAFAKVNPVPEIEPNTDQVKLIFFVDPGKRVYVRRINVFGNQVTRDEVVRQQIWQMESAWASSGLIEQSRSNLLRTGYFEEVQIDTVPVPGTADQIDIDVVVKERMSGRLTGGLGYSQVDNLIFNAGIEQNNFLGTGKSVGFDFQQSTGYTRYRLAYTDPFHTIDGVSRGVDVYYQNIDEEDLNITNYTRDILGGNWMYGIPLTPNQRLNAGVGYDNTLIKTSEDYVSEQVENFVDEYGNRFNSYKLIGGWSYNTFNRAVFPEKGLQQGFNAEVAAPGSTLDYFKLRSNTQYYLPIFGDFISSYRLDLGYGDGYGNESTLPFYLNYFAGGIGSVRGYEINTLGPLDSLGNPIGGNIMTTGSFEIIFPTPFFSDNKSIRTSVFLDGGNVFTTEPDLDNDGGLRFSAGTAVQWLSPLGPLVFSLGLPLNEEDHDQPQIFQFTIGAVY
ncbi:MAG: outer membrane protein assembly factor BamA [Gammaproteobacteria bacterium]